MKKGFTMIELLAVIAIIGILALIAVPVSNKIVLNAKEKLYNEQVDRILYAVKQSAIEYRLLPTSGKTEIYINELIMNGVLENTGIINPKTNNPMNGYVTIELIDGNYVYQYIDLDE